MGGKHERDGSPLTATSFMDTAMSTKIAGFAALSILLFAVPATSALALDRHVLVTNDTSYTIREFYASNVGASSWQEDILGTDVLAPGDSILPVRVLGKCFGAQSDILDAMRWAAVVHDRAG